MTTNGSLNAVMPGVIAGGLDTAGATPAPDWAMHRRHHARGVVGGLICVVVVIYVLWLGTRIVRAIEKFADKYQGRAP